MMQISKMPPGTQAPTPNGGPVNALNLPTGGVEATIGHEATHEAQQGQLGQPNVTAEGAVSGADNMSDEMRARVEQMRQQGADTMGMQQLEPLDSGIVFPDQDYKNKPNIQGEAVSGAENMSDEMRQRLQEFQERGPEATGMEQIKPTPDTSAREHAEAIKQKLREAMENVEVPSFTWGAGSKPVIDR